MPIASGAKRKGPPCQQENNSEGHKRTTSAGPELPEDIWYHILSLLPLRDAARASRVCRDFLCSWKCHPNLTFCNSTMGLNSQPLRLKTKKKNRIFIDRVDQIMKNHSGTGVKSFKFDYYGSYFDTSKLTSWLQIAVTSGIEELEISVELVREQEDYNFPCSLLSAGSGGNSIRGLSLRCCAFRPMAGLGCLTRLHLSLVHITDDELGCLLSSSFALEELDLKFCRDIICLKIPSLLHRLSKLTVYVRTPTVIENKAPNLCTVSVDSDITHISIGDSLQVKCLEMLCFCEFNLVHNARAKLPDNMPNLETLCICSLGEMFSTPCVPGKFLHLKHLDIHLGSLLSGAFSPEYDYFSLVFFLDACPILETFILEVKQTRMEHDSVEDSWHPRQMPGHRHGNIKQVEILGFCSAKSMVELTCHILENATSLECLTLDTILADYYYNYKSCEDAYRLSEHKSGKCVSIEKDMIMEAHKALLAIERYVAVRVPSTIKFNVMKPCSHCHVIESCQPNVIATPTV